ncbi:bifunctional DNA primase/polymerase [Vagococcus vulneris]|uniref:DNA primase n=1 Tax=Vagococcus vulneris TaxID=1977869 RepID=A0A429ZTS8_9ENTE|nr:bifunctional DNA primase/polymerase [Vagococcus vulneris]RST97132.1 hypothetical protein CBF37_10145 [Vagococcus vulneris]
MSDELLRQALIYAEMGLRIFPLSPFSKIPLKNTKGSKEATTDKESIVRWWNTTPKANIGLVTDSFLVLDIDVHSEENNGYKSLEVLEKHFEKLPSTYTVTTANNGLHIYFKKPLNIELPQKISLVKGIDVKAHPNNYIVAPPSQIKRDDNSLGSYSVKDNLEIAECPEWLINFILRDEPNQSRKANTSDYIPSTRYRSKTTDLLESLVKGADTGSRNDTIAKITGSLLAYAVIPSLVYELVHFANSNFNEPLSDSEVNKTFESIVKKELSHK